MHPLAEPGNPTSDDPPDPGHPRDAVDKSIHPCVPVPLVYSAATDNRPVKSIRQRLWERRRLIFRTCAALLLSILILLPLGACVFARHAIYPGQFRDRPTQRIPDRAQVWWIEHDQGKTEAWFLPTTALGHRAPEDRVDPPLAPAVIFSHGNGDLIDDWGDALEQYHAHGVNVLLVEYRGYGHSDGKPTEARVTADFVAAAKRLAAHPGIDPNRIIFHGRSLGGGIVGSAARQQKPAAMILQSTFTRLPAVPGRFGVPEFLVPDLYDTQTFLKTYDRPTLILHGIDDTVIPLRFAEANAATGNQATLHRLEAGHNEYTPGEYWNLIGTFLNEHGLTGDTLTPMPHPETVMP